MFTAHSMIENVLPLPMSELLPFDYICEYTTDAPVSGMECSADSMIETVLPLPLFDAICECATPIQQLPCLSRQDILEERDALVQMFNGTVLPAEQCSKEGLRCFLAAPWHHAGHRACMYPGCRGTVSTKGRLRAKLPEPYSCNLCNVCRTNAGGLPRYSSKDSTVSFDVLHAELVPALAAATRRADLAALLEHTDVGLGYIAQRIAGQNFRRHLLVNIVDNTSILFAKTGKSSARSLLRQFDSDCRMVVQVDSVTSAVRCYAIERDAQNVPVALQIS